MQPSRRGQASHRIAGIAVGVALLLGACGGVEETLPIGLMRGVPEPEDRRIAPRDTSADRYPSLASVPERPVGVTRLDERAAAREALEAEMAAAIERDHRMRAGLPSTTASAYRSAMGEPAELAVRPGRPVDLGRGEGPRGAPADGNGHTVAVIEFPTGSAALSREARDTLARVAERQGREGGRLRVVGHSSSRTHDMPATEQMLVDYRLSADRASAVAEALIDLGVDPDAIAVATVGDTDPRDYETMPAGQARNQRVVILLENRAG